MFKVDQSDKPSPNNRSGMQVSADEPVLVCGRVVDNSMQGAKVTYKRTLFISLQAVGADQSEGERQQLERVDPAFIKEFKRRFDNTEKLKDFKMMPGEM
jgi:hypothetical protein